MDKQTEQIWASRWSAWALWLYWTLATSVTATLSVALSTAQVVGSPLYSFEGDNGIGPLLVWSLCMIMFLGSLVGLAQGVGLQFLMRRHILVPWVAMTVTGVFLAGIAGVFLAVTIGVGASGFVWAVVPGVMLAMAGYEAPCSWGGLVGTGKWFSLDYRWDCEPDSA